MPGKVVTDDIELLSRSMREGDVAAFSELYDRYAISLLGLAIRILRNHTEAEDLVQDVFLHVWHRGHTFDPLRGSVSFWLSLITRTRAIDRLRQRRHHRELNLAETEMTDGEILPIEKLKIEESHARVHQSLKELPEAQRRVVELAYFNGHSQVEIAAILSEPLGTIKTRARLALLKLAEALTPEVNEP